MKKNNKSFKILLIVSIMAIIILSAFTIYKLFINVEKDKTNKVMAQIVKVYTFDNKEEVVEKIVKGQDDVIIFNEKYNSYGKKANDIKILEISDQFVKISRDKIEYLYDGSFPNYNVTSNMVNVIEDVKYNELINIHIDDDDPNSPAMTAARYDYYLKFIK